MCFFRVLPLHLQRGKQQQKKVKILLYGVSEYHSILLAQPQQRVSQVYDIPQGQLY